MLRKEITPLLLLAVFCLAAAASHGGTLLVLPFENHTNKPGLDWIGESIVQSLGEDLSAPDRHVLTREERAAASDWLGIPTSGILSRATIIKIAELTDADLVILGSFELQGDQLSIKTQVLEMKTPRLSAIPPQSGPLKDLLGIQGRVAAALLDHAGWPADVPSGRPRPRVAAWENYIRGLLATERAPQVKYFREAARLEPSYPAPAFQLGKIYMQSRDYQTAVPWLAKLKKEDPNYLEASFLLGLAHFHLEEWDKAEAAFRAVTERLPLNEAYNNLGAVQSRRGKRAAQESFLKALEGDPTDPDYYFNLGYFHWRLGEYPQAIRRFREVLARRPGDGEARLLLLLSLEHLGQTSEAAREREVLARSPGAPRFPPGQEEKRLAQLDRLRRNYDESSFQQLRMTLEIAGEEKLRLLPSGEHASVHLARGRELFQEQRDAEALVEFREAVALDPNNARAHLELARIYARTGRAQEAVAAALRAAELGKKDADPYLVLARIYLDQGKREEAQGAVNQALQREPRNPVAQSLLQTIQSKTAPPR